MTLSDLEPWLLLVAAAHVGFQLTITWVVYPALGEVPPDTWSQAHARHSRRMVPLVAVLYLPLAGLLVWAALAHTGDPGAWLAVAGGVLSMGTTAAVAAPVHGQLGGAVSREDRARLTRRLMSADRVRAVGALLCVAGSLWLAT